MDTNSILLTIKHMLGGLVEDEGHFNLDLVVLINSAFTKLWQLGVGPTDAPFKIEDDTAEWSDFEYDDIEMIKEWIFLDVILNTMIWRSDQMTESIPCGGMRSCLCSLSC